MLNEKTDEKKKKNKSKLGFFFSVSLHAPCTISLWTYGLPFLSANLLNKNRVWVGEWQPIVKKRKWLPILSRPFGIPFLPFWSRSPVRFFYVSFSRIYMFRFLVVSNVLRFLVWPFFRFVRQFRLWSRGLLPVVTTHSESFSSSWLCDWSKTVRH